MTETNAESPRARRRGRRKKTWSRLGNLGRVPTEYEVVTHGMNHTVHEDGRLPLEMGPSRLGNRWLIEHRNQVPLQLDKWDGFRDPDQLTYRAYNKQQDEAETFIDQVIDEYAERQNADAGLSSDWAASLGRVLTPQRYPVHGLQMLAVYTAQMAPTSYITNCATFQASDELRRVQRIAYRTKQLQITRGDDRFGAAEREHWEKDPGWQGVRKAIETALTEYDWDRSFAITNLLLKPTFDELFLRELGQIARDQGDEMDGLILDNLYRDSLRSRHWSAALSSYAIEDRADNRGVLQGYVDGWKVTNDEMLSSAAGMLAANGGGDAGAIEGRARDAIAAHLNASGLG